MASALAAFTTLQSIAPVVFGPIENPIHYLRGLGLLADTCRLCKESCNMGIWKLQHVLFSFSGHNTGVAYIGITGKGPTFRQIYSGLSKVQAKVTTFNCNRKFAIETGS